MSLLIAESMEYGHAVSAGTVALSFARMYASLAALVEALVTNQTTQKATVIQFDGTTEDRPIRLDLSAGLVGSENHTGLETVLGVRPTFLGGTKGVLVEKLADLTWTRAADAETIPTAQGGLTNHRWPKTVAFASTGVLLARTGHEIAKTTDAAPPAVATIFDVGPFRAIVRIPSLGSGGTAVTGIAPISARWR